MPDSPDSSDFSNAIVLWPGEAHEMVFQPIPAGRFRMGSRGVDNDEEPRHWVEITRPFWMGETPVTQAQYRHLAGMCPAELAQIEGNKGAEPSRFEGKDDHPVDEVNWYESQAIAQALSLSGMIPRWLPASYAARLPTEAQWEYACRAGTTTEYHAGEGQEALEKAGWYSGNAYGSTRPVKKKKANHFNLYDMHGNVWEWCLDAWNAAAYGTRGASCFDPFENGEKDSLRVIRGGSWLDAARFCRSAYRYGNSPGFRYRYQGFRLCLSSGPVEKEAASGPEANQEAELRREREGGTTDLASGGDGAKSTF